MRFEKLLMCFILDKNVSQFIGTPGAFVKQFHYLFYVILRYEWKQNGVIKRNILSKWDAWNVNFKKKSFLGHSTNSPRVHCLLKYTVCSMDAYWDTCINLMIKSGCRQKLIKSGCHQKLWKIDYRYIHYIFSVHNLLL